MKDKKNVDKTDKMLNGCLLALTIATCVLSVGFVVIMAFSLL